MVFPSTQQNIASKYWTVTVSITFAFAINLALLTTLNVADLNFNNNQQHATICIELKSCIFMTSYLIIKHIDQLIKDVKFLHVYSMKSLSNGFLGLLISATINVFLRRFEEPKRSLKIVQLSLKICFYNSANKAKYAQEQQEKN